MALKVRIDPADKWFSLCVRLRANNRCERCGRTADEGRLDCSHFYSRRSNATRYSRDNAFAHCFSCHQYLGGNPVEFVKWAESKMGPARVEAISQRHHLTLKLSKVDKAFIAQHYKSQYEAMKAKRDGGHMGYLQFEEWGT